MNKFQKALHLKTLSCIDLKSFIEYDIMFKGSKSDFNGFLQITENHYIEIRESDFIFTRHGVDIGPVNKAVSKELLEWCEDYRDQNISSETLDDEFYWDFVERQEFREFA